jgi:hypothetical protein
MTWWFLGIWSKDDGARIVAGPACGKQARNDLLLFEVARMNWQERSRMVSRAARRLAGVMALLCFVGLAVGCGGSSQVDDPQLKPIQEMLNADLPNGTTEAAVNQFLAARGYQAQHGREANTLVAIIRHIDTQKVEPVTARVTFHFDANDKLKETEIVRAFNQPIPQAQPSTQAAPEAQTKTPAPSQQQ